MFRTQCTVYRPARQNAVWLVLSFAMMLVFTASAKPDIVFQNSASGDLVNWSLNGTSLNSATPLTYPGSTSWKVVGSGDFSGDGAADLLFQNQLSGQLVYWQMNGTNYVQWYYLNPSFPGANWKVAAVCDLDGDGKSDIVFQNQSDGNLVYWLMDGVNLRSYAYLPYPGSVAWKVLGSTDINRDGSADLLFQNQQTGQIVFWIMNRTTFVTYGFVGEPGAPAVKVVGVQDFDGDGQEDILFQNQQTGNLTYWLLNGGNIKGAGSINPTNPGANWQVVAVRRPPGFVIQGSP